MSTVVARRTCLASGYKNRDVINITKEGLGSAYESKLQIFMRKHLREDEEIRYILDGAGYLDIRGLVREHPTDNWIRMHVTPGDLLLVPTGIYHRFGLDELKQIRTMRLLKKEPKWIPHPRSGATDASPSRVDYLRVRFRACLLLHKDFQRAGTFSEGGRDVESSGTSSGAQRAGLQRIAQHRVCACGVARGTRVASGMSAPKPVVGFVCIVHESCDVPSERYLVLDHLIQLMLLLVEYVAELVDFALL